jgi:hypothetical protein
MTLKSPEKAAIVAARERGSKIIVIAMDFRRDPNTIRRVLRAAGWRPWQRAYSPKWKGRKRIPKEEARA